MRSPKFQAVRSNSVVSGSHVDSGPVCISYNLLRVRLFPSACFHFLSGVEPVQVQETVENHLKSLLIKHFDPRKADSIFTEEGEVRCLSSVSNTGS